MKPYIVVVKEKMLQEDRIYKEHVILSYTIKYPYFISDRFNLILNKLNIYYRTKALMYEKTNIANLYQMAMVEYEYAVANNFPIRPFEAYTTFTVTFNRNCAISLYFDQYEYTGGAHGITIRSSDTWHLQKSKKIELKELFPFHDDYKTYIINTINKQITEQIAQGNNIYFENYTQLVQETFKENSFYLTSSGVVIYFQQYDIAPYSSGIVEFTIEYLSGGAVPPSCY